MKSIGGRIIPENEEKLKRAKEENQVLRKIHGQKASEKEKVHFTYCKKQSAFLDVMRVLNRLRGEFNGGSSLRSKLIHTQEMSKGVGKLLALN